MCTVCGTGKKPKDEGPQCHPLQIKNKLPALDVWDVIRLEFDEASQELRWLRRQGADGGLVLLHKCTGVPKGVRFAVGPGYGGELLPP